MADCQPMRGQENIQQWLDLLLQGKRNPALNQKGREEFLKFLFYHVAVYDLEHPVSNITKTKTWIATRQKWSGEKNSSSNISNTKDRV